MNQQLKLSIALTTYNHEAFIAQSLESILTQRVNFNYEIVVGDDKSTDNTLTIVKSYASKYPDKIRVLERHKNLGYTKNFDDTMQQCQGEYIAIFDGDDIMKEGKLKKQVDFLDQNPDCVMVGHIVDAFDSHSKKITRTILPKKKKFFYTIEDLIIEGSFFANSSKVFRRKAYPKTGINPHIKFIADWAVTLDIVGEQNIGFIWETLALYRVHGTSIMQTLKGTDDFHDKQIIIDGVNKKFENKYSKLFKNQWAYAYFIYGLDEFNKGYNTSARKKFLKSISCNYRYSFTVYAYLMASFIPINIRR